MPKLNQEAFEGIYLNDDGMTELLFVGQNYVFAYGKNNGNQGVMHQRMVLLEDDFYENNRKSKVRYQGTNGNPVDGEVATSLEHAGYETYLTFKDVNQSMGSYFGLKERYRKIDLTEIPSQFISSNQYKDVKDFYVKESATAKEMADNLLTGTSDLNDSSEKNALDLSSADVEKWIKIVLVAADKWVDEFGISSNNGRTDSGLVYMNVGGNQMGSTYSFRVTSDGVLECRVSGSEFNDWYIVSQSYLDTSTAVSVFEDMKKNTDSEYKSTYDADIIKSEIIGKWYTVAPTMYDHEDVSEAMAKGKAPQNLIHDGALAVTFGTDNQAKIELNGTYRPDYEETYQIHAGQLVLGQHKITYKLGKNGVTFNEWETYPAGHTITWKITPV